MPKQARHSDMSQPAHSERRYWAADTLERVFGPDPGLLRLQMAGRTVLSAAIALTALLLLTGGPISAAAIIAMGFMISVFANMAVRDPEPMQQALTLLLLFVPALGCIALALFLARWTLAADLCFVLVVTGASLARIAGPRGMALGMVAFISYFIGVIIHPPLASFPQLAAGVGVGVAAAALARFVLLRDNPRVTLRSVRRHIERRIDRIMAEACALLAAGRPLRSEAASHRAHYAIARLNDALLVAQDQIDAIEDASEDKRRHLSNCFFKLELSAERLLRVAANHPDLPGREAVFDRIARLRRSSFGGEAALQPAAPSKDNVLLASLDELERSLRDVEHAIAGLGGERSGR